MKGPSISLQIFVAVMVGVILVAGSFTGLLLGRTEGLSTKLTGESAREDASLLAMLATRGLEQSDTSFATVLRSLRQSGALLRFGTSSEETRVQIFDHNGHLMFDSAAAVRRGEARDETPNEVVAALDNAPPPPAAVGEWVSAVAPIRRADKPVGVVRVLKPSLGMTRILASLGPQLALVAGILLLCATFAAVLIGRRIATPLRRLTSAALEIAAGSRGHALPVPHGREVGELTVAFDRMRRELEDQHRIERLAQDLSHELKNPIAAIRALCETLGSAAIEDPAAATRQVQRINDTAVRLDGIVHDLLSLARLEAKGIDRSSTVALGTLVEEAAVEAEAAWQGHIERSVPAGMVLSADPFWLRRALVNLLANALAAGGTASIAVQCAEGPMVIRVRNPGEIPANVRPRLFERFATRRPEGTGLGLAIVRAVAEGHGGTVEIEQFGPPEVAIVLRLPAA